jgi:YD repeat-containing protein
VIKETQAIDADLGPLGINTQGLERRYAYDALGQLTDTLDMYLDGADLLQSGQSVVYNAFGEIIEEQRTWGPASQSVAALNTATLARYFYDNAGHVFNKVAADGLTVYYYNLAGQITREDKRGNSNDTDHTGRRITETQYDVLGRAILIRRPAFDADITPGTGTTVRLVTPYSRRTLDRWGNLTGHEQGGYEFVNGQPVFAPFTLFRYYGYDDNNQRITELLGTHEFFTSSGAYNQAQISKHWFRDLQGSVVREVDEARDPQSEELLRSRTRHKQYNSVGQLTADIDATDRKVDYAYSIHGDRLGTRNARGTVFFDRHDRTGNIRFHGVLRTSSPAGVGEYNSLAGTGTIGRIAALRAKLSPTPPTRRGRTPGSTHAISALCIVTRWASSRNAATTRSAISRSTSTARAPARNGMPRPKTTSSVASRPTPNPPTRSRDSVATPTTISANSPPMRSATHEPSTTATKTAR